MSIGRFVSLGQLHVTDCQLDELWSFVHPKEDLFLMVQIDRETDGDA